MLYLPIGHYLLLSGHTKQPSAVLMHGLLLWKNSGRLTFWWLESVQNCDGNNICAAFSWPPTNPQPFESLKKRSVSIFKVLEKSLKTKGHKSCKIIQKMVFKDQEKISQLFQTPMRPIQSPNPENVDSHEFVNGLDCYATGWYHDVSWAGLRRHSVMWKSASFSNYDRKLQCYSSWSCCKTAGVRYALHGHVH